MTAARLGRLVFFVGACAAAADSTPRQLHGGPPPPNVQRTKECPAGFELTGKNCVATEILPPNLVCPPGTRDVGGGCLTTAAILKSCAEGAALTGGDRCVRVDRVPADRVCDQGVLTGNACHLSTPVPSICPPGYTDANGQCIQKSPVEKICPPGYALNGKECSTVVRFEATPTCPTDFILGNGPTCTKEVPVPPACAPGFTLYGGQACERTVPKIPAPCPDGYEVQGSLCRMRTNFRTRPVCPDGYTLNGDICEKFVPVPATCPPGTIPGPFDGQCHRPAAKVPVCNEDEKLVGTTCQRDAFYHSELQCSPGFALVHGKCKKVDKFASALRCTTGGALKDDSCVSQSTSVPLLQCEPGFQLAKGPKCIREVQYDCSKRVTSNECDFPDFVRLDAERTKSKVAAASKTTEQKDPASKTPRCAPVVRVVPETCSKTEEKPPQYVCADGSAPVGKDCVATKSVPAEVFCPRGQFDRASGECLTITVLAASRVCPRGSLRPDNNCQEVKTRPADRVCPEGTEPLGTECAIFTRVLTHPDQRLTNIPSAVCDVGAKQGNTCVVVEDIPRGEMCPAGSEDRGQCIVASPVILSKPNVFTRSVTWVCPSGPAAGNTCSRTEVVQSTYICREGTQQGNACVTTAGRVAQPPLLSSSPARPVCSKGFELQGSWCSQTVVFPPTLTCPAGFSNYGKEEQCTKDHPRTEICPAGTTRSDNGCVKRTFAPPRVTEVKVCTKGEQGCY